MLKIKDDINISILEKYGFEFEYNTDENDECWYAYQSKDVLLNVGCDNRDIIFYCSIEDGYKKALDVLYDLIKDGLVEKC